MPPEPIDSFADGDTSLSTGDVRTQLERALGGGEEEQPDSQAIETNEPQIPAPPAGTNDDFSVGAEQKPQQEQEFQVDEQSDQDGQDRPDQPDQPSGLSDLQREAQAVYGFTEGELENLGDEQLLNMLAAMDRRFTAQWGGNQQVQAPPNWQQQQAAPQQPQHPTEPQPGQQQAAEDQDLYHGFQPEKFSLEGLEDQGFEPEVVQAFEQLSEHYQNQFQGAARSIQQMEAVIGDMLYERQADQSSEYERAMDGFFGGLGESLQKQYGSGRAAEMDPQSPEFSKRMEFANEVNMFLQHAMQTGQPVDLSQIQQRVLRSRHVNEMDAQTRQGIREEAQARRRQAINRPNVPPTGKSSNLEENAANFANQFYRERGMEPDTYSQKAYGDI
jgi:hypothetical protein